MRHARPQVREALGRQADEGCRLRTTKAGSGAAGDVGALSPGSSCGDSRCSLSRIISNCPGGASLVDFLGAALATLFGRLDPRADFRICCTPLV